MSDTPRTDAHILQTLDAGIANHYLARLNLLIPFARELERELSAANKRFEALAFDAARVEWKYGRNDDGTRKNWTEWINLRESLGEHVRQPQELEPDEAQH